MKSALLCLVVSIGVLGVPAATACPDAVFLRRAYLDTIGTLPTADEARAFLSDPDPNKRSALVDHLLAREEFADYWSMKWSELLRVKSEFPINLWPNAVQAYHQWIRASIRDNVPYDRFVRELLTESGSNFRVPPVNFYRAVQSRDPQTIASAVALTFMGTRAERWHADQRAGMAVFFSRIGYKQTGEWKEEIVFFDRGDKDLTGTFPDGTSVRVASDADPREVFTNWLVTPGNPWFARNIVNRIWAWLLGRGLIQEPDDVRPDNPPSNPARLAFLERELVSSHFDLRHIYGAVLTSPEYESNDYVVRPLEAEVLIDAIDQITGTTEQYSSLIPEPYTFIPEDQRAIAIADGSITSGFLETFGRPSRDTGLESERNTKPSAAQRLHLLNSSHIQRKLEQSPALQKLIQSTPDQRQLVTKLYLTILSRFASEDELRLAADYARKPGMNKRLATIDLAWALINSEEFLYRH
jgi:uncharacterized protein DUF1549/uncharacterized protein DUF1553